MDWPEVRDKGVAMLDASVELIHGDDPEIVLVFAPEEDGVVGEDLVDVVGVGEIGQGDSGV